MSNENIKIFDWSFDKEAEYEPIQIKGRKLFIFFGIFIFLISLAVFFLCTRWFFRNRNRSTTNTPSQTSPFYSQTQGIDPDAIKKLPIIVYQTNCCSRVVNESVLNESECCICLSAFGDGDKLKVLPGCDHCFHFECVDAWLLNHSNCPLCRNSLKIDSSFSRILIQEPPIIRYDFPF